MNLLGKKWSQLLFIAITLLHQGCATTLQRDARVETDKVQLGPRQEPRRNMTQFREALRCMDKMFIKFGINGVPIMVEDLNDNTKKVNTGTRDMLISAISDMTYRSRGVKLITFGNDTGNLNTFMAAAARKDTFENVPRYDIRGSISQLDDGIFRKQLDGGMLAKNWGVDYSSSAQASVLAMDLSVISATDTTLVSGVTSRNEVVIYKTGTGTDADATIKKLGISFSLGMAKNDATAQGLRNLVELGAIELFGKLFRVPYWACLGVDETHPDVQAEISNWYYVLHGKARMTEYVQFQLKQRGLYEGPSDGKNNSEFRKAVIDERIKFGLTPEAILDEKLFAAIINDNTPQAVKEQVQLTPRDEEKTKAPNDHMRVSLLSGNGKSKFKSGEQVVLRVESGTNAYVYCYLKDENQKLNRIFPNRFQKENYIPANQSVTIPNHPGFQIVANDQQTRETVQCYATETDVTKLLSPLITGMDLDQSVSIRRFETLQQAYAKASNGKYAMGEFHVDF